MHVIDQIGKVHGHGVERLNFASNINVPQFNQRAERTAGNARIVSGVFPDKLRIPVVVNNRL